MASGYSGPEVLELHDVVLPQPGAGQVLIDVNAAGPVPTRSTTSCTAATWAMIRTHCPCRSAWSSRA